MSITVNAEQNHEIFDNNVYNVADEYEADLKELIEYMDDSGNYDVNYVITELVGYVIDLIQILRQRKV